MVSKTEVFVLTSGWTSGLAVGCVCNVDGGGSLRAVRLKGYDISGTARLICISDGDVFLDGTVVLGSGAIIDVDLMTSSLTGSGTILTSASPTVVSFEEVRFSRNLSIQYSMNSGNVTVRSVINIQKSLV